MQKIILLVLIAAIAACNNTEKKTDTKQAVNTPAPAVDSLLVSDSSWGLIRKTTDFSALTALYGRQYVKDERICGPECVDSLDVTILYPGQRNEAIIYWNDSAYHKTISFIECRNDSAGYHTTTGTRIGSGFAELVKLNGQRINFSGFGWDYGGSIISYNKGALASANIHYELDLKGEGAEGLWGDTELHTDMPLVKQYLKNMRVSKLMLIFN